MIKALFLAAILSALPVSFAHRGCHLRENGEFYINENCPEGVRMARRFGYAGVEDRKAHV